jgi:hypothetical protein
VGSSATPHATGELVREEIASCKGTSFVARIDVPGVPECFLVVLRDSQDFEPRIQQAAVTWRVTAREREVLPHVTSLLRKSRCDSRSRLVASFWATL